MGIFGHHKEEKPEPSIYIGEVNIFFEAEEKHHHRPHQHVKLVLKTKINNFKITFMALTLDQGEFSLDQLALIDTDTNNQVAASFANVQPFTNDNPAVLKSEASPDGDPTKVKNTAVGAGTANVSTQAAVTYTDSKTNQSVTKTLKLFIPYTVVAVVGSENVALTLIQGTPQAVPAQ